MDQLAPKTSPPPDGRAPASLANAVRADSGLDPQAYTVTVRAGSVKATRCPFTARARAGWPGMRKASGRRQRRASSGIDWPVRKLAPGLSNYSDNSNRRPTIAKVAAQRQNQVIVTLSGAPNAVSGKRFPSYAWTGKVGNTAGPKTDPRGIANVLRNPFALSHISEFRPLFVVIADFYRHNRPLFTFGSAAAITIVLLVSFALTPRADDLALFAIAATMTVAALYAVRNTPVGDRAQHTTVPPCGSTLGSDRAYSRRWPTAFGADLAGPAGLDRRGRRWSCDPHGIASEDTARGRLQTGGRANLHAGA